MTDQCRLGELPSEILSIIMQHCHEVALISLCPTNRRIHDHATRERRLRLQKKNFHLFEREADARQNKDTIRTITRQGHPLASAFWAPDHFDMVTRIIWKDTLPVFRQLLKWGLNIRHYNRDGCPIIAVVFRHHDRQISRFLQQNRYIRASDVNIPVSIHESAFNIASLMVRGGRIDAVNYLIDIAGENLISALDIRTAIQGYATLDVATMTRLLSMNYPVIFQDVVRRRTPLHAAMGNPDPNMLELVLPRTDPSFLYMLSVGGQTLLWDALEARNYVALEKLLTCGVDPRITDSDGWTVLHTACYQLNSSAVRILLQHQANPNQGDMTFLGTPLHCMCRAMLLFEPPEQESFRAPAERIYRMMLAAGARTNALTTWGQSVDELLERLPEGIW